MFWKNFEKLCTFKGISPNGVCKELGLSNAAATHWKQGAKPNNSTLKRIADYFSVTPESLLAENEQKKSPSEMDEDQVSKEELAKIFSNLLPEQQEQAKVYLRYLLDTQEKTPQDNP